MSRFRRLLIFAFLVAGPIAFFVIETAPATVAN